MRRTGSLAPALPVTIGGIRAANGASRKSVRSAVCLLAFLTVASAEVPRRTVYRLKRPDTRWYTSRSEPIREFRRQRVNDALWKGCIAGLGCGFALEVLVASSWPENPDPTRPTDIRIPFLVGALAPLAIGPLVGAAIASRAGEPPLDQREEYFYKSSWRTFDGAFDELSKSLAIADWREFERDFALQGDAQVLVRRKIQELSTRNQALDAAKKVKSILVVANPPELAGALSKRLASQYNVTVGSAVPSQMDYCDCLVLKVTSETHRVDEPLQSVQVYKYEQTPQGLVAVPTWSSSSGGPRWVNSCSATFSVSPDVEFSRSITVGDAAGMASEIESFVTDWVQNKR